ncbi:MAG: copper transporter [Aeromicrobium sp.]
MKTLRRRLLVAATVLFALGLGIALGSGPLNRPADVLPGSSADTGARDQSLGAFESGFVDGTAGKALGGKLKGRHVVLITLTGADSDQVAAIRGALKDADATIVSEPKFAAKLTDPANRQFVDSVARQAALKVREVEKGPASYQRIGSALARALLGDAGEKPDESGQAIWEAFVEGDLVTGDKPKELGDSVVMVAGRQRNGSASKVIAELARAIGSHGEGMVLAGPSRSSLTNGAIAALREGPGDDVMSTVDVTDSVAGPVVVALALGRDAAGKPGAWGTPRSADGPVPGE